MYFVIFEILEKNKVFIVSLLTVEVMYETSIKATIVNENKMKMTMFNMLSGNVKKNEKIPF